VSLYVDSAVTTLMLPVVRRVLETVEAAGWLAARVVEALANADSVSVGHWVKTEKLISNLRQELI